MAIINTYPTATPKGADLLIGTQVKDDTVLENSTKSFSVDALGSYIVTSTSGITGSGTLDTIAMFTPSGQAIGDSFITQTASPDVINVGARFNVSPAGILALEVTQVTGKALVTISDDLKVEGTYYDAASDEGTDGDLLVAKGTPGNMVTRWVSKANADVVSGSGTLNTVAMFTPNGQAIGDSPMFKLPGADWIQVGVVGVGQETVLGPGFVSTTVLGVTNISASEGGEVTLSGNVVIGDGLGLPDYLTISSSVQDSNAAVGTEGQILVADSSSRLLWDDAADVVSGAVAKLIPFLTTASPGGSETYTALNNIVKIGWLGGNGIYVINLPSATAIPYRNIRFTTNGTYPGGGAHKVRFTPTGGETIDGAAYYEISKAYEGISVWSTGTEWVVIQAKAH